MYLTAGIWTEISTTSWVRQKTRMRREWEMNVGLWRRIRIEGEINTVSVNVGRAGKEKEELWSPKTGHWEWEEVKWRQRGQLWSHGGSWDLNFTDPTGNYSHCNIKGSKIIISVEQLKSLRKAGSLRNVNSENDVIAAQHERGGALITQLEPVRGPGLCHHLMHAVTLTKQAHCGLWCTCAVCCRSTVTF